MKRSAVLTGMSLFCVFTGAIALADPIHEAAGAGRIEKVRQLLAEGAGVDAKSGGGTTPLHDAAMWGHRDVAELLLSKGADVNAKEGNGMTPLHLAANGNHANLAASLIGRGAAVDAKASNGWTPLHVAAAWGHTSVAKVLIANGADINARANGGSREFRAPESTGKCHKDIAALLGKKGADPRSSGAGGMTPLHAAVLNGQKDMAEYLKEHRAGE